MIKQVTQGVQTHQSEFLQSNAVIVQAPGGLLVIDPGITSDEMAALANDLQALGTPVVAGYSTHPHWDHLLWHAALGNVPRYGTERNQKEIEGFLANNNWKEMVAPMLPPAIAAQIPMDDLFGKITGLPTGTTHIPWEGPAVRIFEHQGHTAGSATLLVEESGVLVAGDMLSDILIPFLDLDAADPITDYLEALELLEGLASEVKFFVPGHGSVGNANEMLARIKQDRAYVEALRDGIGINDRRLAVSPNKEVHEGQRQHASKNG